MPKWKADATEFSVNITYNEEKGSQIRVPKPILEKIGNPEKLKFVIEKNGRIVVEPQRAIEPLIDPRVKDIVQKRRSNSKRTKE